MILGYRWLAGTVAFAFPAKPEIRAVEGVSKYRDYRLSYYTKRFGGEVSYTRYMGFLIGNSSTLSAATLNGATYYQIPDLETLGFGATVMYVLSAGSFSLASAVDQSELQEKSGGALLLVSTFRQQNVTSNDAWIPTEKKPLFGTDQNISRAFTSALAAGAGYGYNFILGDVFASGLLALSLGYQHISYANAGLDLSGNSIDPNVHLRMALGANALRFFITLGVYADYYVHHSESLQLNTGIYGATLAGGLRF